MKKSEIHQEKPYRVASGNPRIGSSAKWVLRVSNGLRHTLFAILCGIVGGIVASTGEFVHNAKEICEWFRWCQSETLELADSGAKSAFSDRLSRAAMNRMIRARFFHTAVTQKSAPADLDANWRAYVEAAADWNVQIPIFYAGLARWYSDAKLDQFGKIHNDFRELNSIIGALRRSNFTRQLQRGNVIESTGEEDKLISGAEEKIDLLNSAILFFSFCLGPNWPMFAQIDLNPCELKKTQPMIFPLEGSPRRTGIVNKVGGLIGP